MCIYPFTTAFHKIGTDDNYDLEQNFALVILLLWVICVPCAAIRLSSNR